MNTQGFLEHHGIARNPFAEEDAQTDPVFKQHCIENAYHPAWDKVYGDPTEPATAIIFGPKGSGKTAMRLQIDRHLVHFNEQNPDGRVYIIRYDDFNPFLDHFCERLGRRAARKPEKALDAWRLWDHMDAILCLGVTELIDQVLMESDSHRPKKDNGNRIDTAKLSRLDRNDARDLLLLAASYDQSTSSTFSGRFEQLRKRLSYGNWTASLDFWFASVWCVLVVLIFGWLFWNSADEEGVRTWNLLWFIPVLCFFGKLPYLIRWTRNHFAAMGIHRHMRVGKRETSSVRKVLMQFPAKELASQPLPRYDRTDDRYELLRKFQSLLSRLGFDGVIVLMDRVDEPHMTGGKPELMRRFVWPLLDNKLLKHPGMGFKLMLPEELYRDTERESREFHERARLDKQNVIPAFAWTGESLYDLTRSRMLACAAEGKHPDPKELFDDSLSYERMLSAFESLRVPRHLFRFLYRVLVEHCNQFTDGAPKYKIDASTFETSLAVYVREMDRV
ncbi:ATP-binding protein [Rhodopirellula sp. JC740]|uniref:ATP-binding protein n=1 Tax=Rhodopirellula halodulae TaxID=2894198 RepID=A0ABS8NEB1_9BACT|nr:MULTISPECIES: ATP-binding protein [unclassified Rhodopirellula]MCC9641272.1 ATP-binding protein [Rhodopirellula sp. JC740]MCC9657680.1 ATP-binding protein [Rhodopirellula sp. JC737]